MTHLLEATLEAAVPLWIMQLEQIGGPSEALIEKTRSALHETLVQADEVLLYRSKTPGKTAQAFNDLAQGIAVLSFCPGGIRAFGRHYEGQYRRHEQEKPSLFVLDPARPEMVNRIQDARDSARSLLEQVDVETLGSDQILRWADSWGLNFDAGGGGDD